MLANVPAPGRDFGALQRYLVDGHAGARDSDRVTFIVARNLICDDPAVAARIMHATAALSARVKRPVYHLIVSWRRDENPDPAVMLAVLDTTLADIGLDGHQALIVGHGDTDNRHLHAMINRVHPDTGVAWSTSHDYRRVECSMRRQAEALGFIFVPGRHNQPDSAAMRPRPASAGERRMLHKADAAPLPQWPLAQTRELGARLRPMLERACDWSTFVAAVAASGCEVVAKGQGLIVTDRQRSGYAKLSSLRTGLRAKDIAERFGQSFADWAAGHQQGRGQAPLPLGPREPEPTRLPTQVQGSLSCSSAPDCNPHL